MTGLRIGRANDVGRLCRALAVRLPPGVDAGRLSMNLARVLAATSATGGARLWVEEVPADADSELALAKRERECGRTVDPALGAGIRVVLLRYRNGLADVVVVAHRAVLPDPAAMVAVLVFGNGSLVLGDRSEPETLRDALRCVDGEPAPDWGLATPGTRAVGRTEFRLPITGTRNATLGFTAALALALSRCTGSDRVLLGGDDPRRVQALAVPDTGTVQGYLDGVRQTVATPMERARPPTVGLIVTGPGRPHGAEGTAVDVVHARPFLAPTYPLTIHLCVDDGAELPVVCWYHTDAFASDVVEQLVRMLVTTYRNLAGSAPGTSLSEIELFDAAELRGLAESGGLGVAVPVPAQTIHGAVAAQARRRPDAVALCFGPQRLTYRELDERADRAAAALRQLGVRAGDRVGVCLRPSLDLVVVLLAVLKAGAAYVPMDPAYPAQRLAFTCRDAALAVVVTSCAFPESPGLRLVRAESLALADQPSRAPADAEGADDTSDAQAVAYVIYTSGSTGQPKGVVVLHRNVVSLLAATEVAFAGGDQRGNRAGGDQRGNLAGGDQRGNLAGGDQRGNLELGHRDVWTLFHSVAFDFSVWEIWGCLMTGGRLVVVPHGTARDPAEFTALLERERVTVLNQTPSAFSQLLEVDQQRPVCDSVRLVVFGGEPLATRTLRSWFDRHPERGCRLVNMFGITETTVHVTSQTLSRQEALSGSRSVGRALPGWHVYILDAAGRPVPPGVSGEIYVGGAGVARGYLNRPDLTEQRFLPDPMVAGQRMYRSGDRGRLLPDGRLEHLGRLDNQVKLRGFRIELDEIRASLLQAPSVASAAVVLHQRGGDPASARLDSYVVFGTTPAGKDPAGSAGSGAGGPGDVEEVRRHVARFLPEYMVPSTVTALAALPLTPNGKIDLDRLPEPLAGTAPTEVSMGEGTDGDPSAVLGSIWERVFGLRIGPDDDFFALGGNSLLAVRLFEAMRSAGLPQIALRELYLHRTVRRLSAALTDAAVDQSRAQQPNPHPGGPTS